MSEEIDELEGKAAELIIRENKASTSFVQRHLQIGYNRAALIIESLEKKGIITAPNEIGKREVTEKGKKSLEVSEKIMDISEKTGQSPEKVLETASKIIDDKKSKADAMIDAEENRVEEEKAARPELPGIGHNKDSDPKDVGGVGGARLLSFIERIERIEEELAALNEDKKEVKAEAKGIGFDVKTITKIVKLRAMDSEKRREEEEILDLYKAAVGLV